MSPTALYVVSVLFGMLFLPVGRESAVEMTPMGGLTAAESDVAVDDIAGHIVVWRNSSSDQIRGRFFSDSEGLSEFEVASMASGNTCGSPAIALSTSGTFVVVWEQSTSGATKDIYAQRMSSTGTKIGTPILVPTVGQSTRNQVSPKVAARENGDFFVAWTDEFSVTDFDVRARFFQFSDGTPLTTDFGVVTTSNLEDSPAIAVVPEDTGNGSGDLTFAIAYRIVQPDGRSDIFCSRYDGDGAAIGGPFLVNTAIVSTNRMQTPDVSLGWIAGVSRLHFVWRNEFDSKCYFKRFDSSASAIDLTDVVVQSSYSSSNPMIAAGWGGYFGVSINDGGLDGRLWTYDATGSLRFSFILPLYAGERYVGNRAIAVSRSGRFIAAAADVQPYMATMDGKHYRQSLFNLVDAESDFDGDGVSNWREGMSGTRITTPADFPLEYDYNRDGLSTTEDAEYLYNFSTGRENTIPAEVN
ncbi:hypothetical protein KQI84_14735 [bacterium]|nr:hypothetical protein [bacterium]